MNKYTLLLCCAISLSGCSKVSDEAKENAVEQPPQDIVAKVGKHVITESDLDAMVIRTVGEFGAYQLGEQGRQKVLESMVLAKVMATAQQAAMNEYELAEMARAVTTYREELLTKGYLKANIVAQPVTVDMVSSYYQANLEKFGAKTVKTFEVIKGNVKLKGPARKKMLAAIAEAAKSNDWKAYAGELKRRGLAIEHATGTVVKGTLKSSIDKVIHTLTPQQTSGMHFINGLPVIARVISEQYVQPKPLSAVSATIRKSLAPLQMRKAIKLASHKLLEATHVEYISSSSDDGQGAKQNMEQP